MKNNLIGKIAIVLVLAIILNGCRSCPNKEVVGPFLVYPTLDNLLVYKDIQTLTFISDAGNELKFEKYLNTHKEIKEFQTNYSYDCEYDPTINVSYCADVEVSDYHYATENNDTLKINYRASVVNWPNPEDFFHTYYKAINLYGPSYYAISEARAQWETESKIETSKNKLETPYMLEGHQFSNVYYWEKSTNNHKVLFFNDEYGLVGFDVFGEKWIRKI